MKGRRVLFKRAFCSHFLTAGLDPDTSSCVNLCTYNLIYILKLFIHIYVYYSTIFFWLCLRQDFTLLKSAAVSSGLIRASPNPPLCFASSVCQLSRTKVRKAAELLLLFPSVEVCAGQQCPSAGHTLTVAVRCPHMGQASLERGSTVLN